MTDRRHRSLPLIGLLAIVASVAAGCGSSTSTGRPSPSTAPSSSTAATTDAPTPAPTTPTPTASPAPTASEADACPIEPQTGRLPSDRLTDVVISTSPTADLITFVFGNMSLPEPPQGSSTGSLEAATPPFTEGASGLPIDVDGEHVAQVRFSGMSIVNDVGEPTYDGRKDFRPDLPALKAVVNYDLSEGVVGWYVGYDGPGCVTLSAVGNEIVLAIDHGPG